MTLFDALSFGGAICGSLALAIQIYNALERRRKRHESNEEKYYTTWARVRFKPSDGPSKGSQTGPGE